MEYHEYYDCQCCCIGYFEALQTTYQHFWQLVTQYHWYFGYCNLAVLSIQRDKLCHCDTVECKWIDVHMLFTSPLNHTKFDLGSRATTASFERPLD